MSGFKKCGIHPLNPGQLALSTALHPPQESSSDSTPSDNSPSCGSSVDMKSLQKESHPDTIPASTDSQKSVAPSCSISNSASADVLSDILVLSKPKPSKKKISAVNSKQHVSPIHLCLSSSNEKQRKSLRSKRNMQCSRNSWRKRNKQPRVRKWRAPICWPMVMQTQRALHSAQYAVWFVVKMSQCGFVVTFATRGMILNFLWLLMTIFPMSTSVKIVTNLCLTSRVTVNQLF